MTTETTWTLRPAARTSRLHPMPFLSFSRPFPRRSSGLFQPSGRRPCDVAAVWRVVWCSVGVGREVGCDRSDVVDWQARRRFFVVQTPRRPPQLVRWTHRCYRHPDIIGSEAQIPLCRLPRDVRDKPVTFPLAKSHYADFPETSPARRNGILAKGDVMGLSRMSRESRHSGIWASVSE